MSVKFAPHFLFLASVVFVGCQQSSDQSASGEPAAEQKTPVSYSSLEVIQAPEGAYEAALGLEPDERETHLSNIRQLSFGGENAEAYWSWDGDKVCLQVTNPERGIGCDQIFWAEVGDGPLEMHPVSDGTGRTTCSYFMPDNERIIYASTKTGGEDCPPVPDKSNGYVWPLYESFELYTANKDGSDRKQLTDNGFYDAEATVSPKGDKIVFTSTRDGDIDLYTMDIDGSNITRVTHDLGYDGGAFFTPDGEELIFRASRPKTEEEQREYQRLLNIGLVMPMDMELFMCKIDGSDLRQITHLGGANWAPFMHPDNERIIFCSNHHTGGFPFNLFMINRDGTGLEQITFNDQFDSFPMFSSDGTKLIFASNRNNGETRDTNVFLADWVD
jgi:Tol biopolymer transport system component